MYCCFTGHRPEHLPGIFREDSEYSKNLKNVLSSVIDTAISDGYTDFYCGMARGIDMLAAELVIEKAEKGADISLHAVIPCSEQSENWKSCDKVRYNEILKNVKSKTIISPVYTETCMLTRNRFMVDNSQRLIAVWNGFFRGGTAYTVKYAKKEKKEIHLIRPKDLSITVL